MTGPGLRADFFRREATESLRELTALLAESTPAPEALARLARGLRGAATLAGPPALARATVEFEQIARLVRDGTLGWHLVAPRLGDPLERFQALADSAATWTPALDHDAEELTERFRTIAGDRAAPARLMLTPSGEGTRAFVAREVAVVAGAVERLVHTSRSPQAWGPDSVAPVRRAMQSLLGLAALGDFPPLSDLLDALEVGLREAVRETIGHPPTAFLTAESRALARVAGDIVERGTTSPGHEQVDRVAECLGELLGVGPGTVPVETLLDPSPGAVERYAAVGGAPAWADSLDLVSLGGTLQQAADQIEKATSTPIRRLRALGLLAALRGAQGGFGRRPGGRLVAAIAGALADDIRGRGPEQLVEVIEKAGAALANLRKTGLESLEHELDSLAGQLGPDQVVPIETLLEEPVPIEWLAPTEEESGAPADWTRLERSLSHYSRLRRAAPDIPLIGARRTSPIPVPAQVEDLTVPIAQLLYRGRAALRRADEVRTEIQRSLAASSTRLDRLEPLVRELLDLVPLALVDAD
jgi:HPt (histidine-containing phosphotransfer) domain-containing protein